MLGFIYIVYQSLFYLFESVVEVVNMEPSKDDVTVNIPVTFDYKGGRNENKKNKIIATLVCIVLCTIGIVGTWLNDDIILWKKVLLIVAIFSAELFFVRFYILHEVYYSDIFEQLKEVKNIMPVTKIWSIFDIEYDYPYICYFKNGMKGIFVKMEKDAITGKGKNARYDHYEAISDAYNLGHSLNMDIRHIDYMDNVGNDPRLVALYDGLKDVSNPDMEEALIDIYSNLQDEMSQNYSSFDIYLFLTRDKLENFTYNVQNVCNTMLGGNFITYRVLNRNDIRTVCIALFNLHDFSVTDACEEVLKNQSHRGIVPIKIIHPDMTEEKLNDTQEEKRIKAEEAARKAQEAKAEAKAEKARKRKAKKGIEEEKVSDEDLDLFD